jgi:hypothetical protein
MSRQIKRQSLGHRNIRSNIYEQRPTESDSIHLQLLNDEPAKHLINVDLDGAWERGRRRGTLMRRGRRIRRASSRSETRLLGGLLGAVVRIGGPEGVGIYGGSGRAEVGKEKESRAVTVPSAPQFLDESDSDAAGGSRGVFEKDGGRFLGVGRWGWWPSGPSHAVRRLVCQRR